MLLGKDASLAAGLRGPLLSKAAPPSGLRLARPGSSDRQEFPDKVTRTPGPVEYGEAGPSDTTIWVCAGAYSAAIRANAEVIWITLLAPALPPATLLPRSEARQ